MEGSTGIMEVSNPKMLLDYDNPYLDMLYRYFTVPIFYLVLV